jgi:exosortase/archaeosortase family protein
MLIFVGAIYYVQAKSRKKWYAFFATVPVIYVLNLIRNVGVIYMMDELGWSYEMAHHEVGRGGSFLALIVLAAIVFRLLPELLDNIWGMVDLKDRDKVSEEKTEKEEEAGEDEGEVKEIGMGEEEKICEADKGEEEVEGGEGKKVLGTSEMQETKED